jgi:ubiquitin-protein ligase
VTCHLNKTASAFLFSGSFKEPIIFHPNVYADGGYIDLALFYPKQWDPNTTLETMLLAIQNLLENSTGGRGVANSRAYNMKKRQKERYKAFVLQNVEDCRARWLDIGMDNF